MRIPKVREWKLSTAAGIFRVLAPTRRLAVLNLRHAGIYESVFTVGTYRKQVGQTAPVQKETPRRQALRLQGRVGSELRDIFEEVDALIEQVRAEDGPCDCGERKCEECEVRNEGEGDWGPER
jgi:hypothetical protein